MDATIITAFLGAIATIVAAYITARAKDKSAANLERELATQKIHQARKDPPSNPIFDLTGIWNCDDRALYYVRQLGSRIFWIGERSPQNPRFCNVAYGSVSPFEVTIEFADVPKGVNREWGTMVLQITDNGTRMTATKKTGNFGGSTWIRIPG
jgi:hypothetical protein